MSQASDLLDSLNMADPAQYAAGSSEESHIVIGADRFITVPRALQRIAVESDHDIETVIFDCPRYWDDHDLSKMAIYINYMRADGYGDSYPVTDISVDGDIMHFNWTISRNVTAVKGQISFLVCAKKTDAEGNETNHWNSEINQDMYVSEGMETEEQILEQQPDLVTSLLLRMSAVEEINVQADEMQRLYENTQAVAATAEAVKNEALDASDYIKNSYANAIKGAAKGEIVRVDDVSPIAHTFKVKAHGKNLLSLTGTPTVQVTGSLTYRSWSANPNKKTLTLSVIEKDPSVDISEIYFGFSANPRDGLDGVNWLIERGVVKNEYVKSNLPYISVYPATDDTINKLTTRFDIQLEEGSIPTEYEPWIDPSTVTVIGCGKNMFSYPFDGTAYGNGVTFTDAGDGGIIVNGKNNGESNSVFYISQDSYLTFPAGTYSCSPNIPGMVLMGVEKGGGYFTLASENKFSFTLSEPKTFRSIYIQIGKGNTTEFSNKKVWPMIELSSSLGAFEKFTGVTYTPATDGSVDISSVSPTMTIFTDTPGVIVEAEYNRDTTKAMTSYIFTEEIKNDIAAVVESDMAEVLASLNSYAESLIGGDN